MSNEQQFKAWAAFEPKGQLSEWSYTPRPIGPNDVEIDITHCGMCASGKYRDLAKQRDLIRIQISTPLTLVGVLPNTQ